MLNKAKTLKGYKLQNLDREIGKVKEFYFDDHHWTIRYLIADTGNWLTDRQVLIPPQWIEHISWSDSKVFVNLLSETIKQSPEYTEESLLTRDYETGLHRHYNHQGYWVDEPDDNKYSS